MRIPSLAPPLALAALVAALSLSGCAAAQDGGAPSLAPRPVEGRFDVAPPAVVVEPPGPLPTDLAGRLARWDADATKAQQDFAAERNLTAPLVSAATGSAMSSERWVVAQQAISRLIAARAPLTGALADIDRLYIDRSVEEQIDGLPDIYALRDRLAGMVSAQDAVIGALQAELPGQ
ncbi:hypothetical protein [Sphingopyxis panaciterrulae]|uniref:Uncharacterized protein n=1 Tax=Sphingopyxis panaciterrulae TaxID=462372 RepID=A0A7W9EPN6_9SPHN|nr:hypothetical protein [Sphingopyxis panaciterrulae]MBB5705778.1 hypothetical protein [Sphingopyxis panaciterrulae]